MVQVGDKSPNPGINSINIVPPNLAVGNWRNRIKHQKPRMPEVIKSIIWKESKSNHIQSPASLIIATKPIIINSASVISVSG